MIEQQKTWIAQLKKGNDLAAFKLYESYSKAMYNTLTRITGDHEIAKDLLQDAFIKAFQRIGELEKPEAFGGWLKRIVVNMGIQHMRKSKISFDDVTDHAELANEEVEEELISMEQLHQAIKELPDGYRSVLSLYLFENYKHAEIAEMLGITESTSKTQYRNAKQILRKQLAYAYEN